MSKKLAAGSTHLLIDIPGRADGQDHQCHRGHAAAQAVRIRRRPLRTVGRGDHDRRPPADRQRHRSGARGAGRHGGAGQRSRRAARPCARNRCGSPRHLLEYDPKLRGGAGYARARELLESGAALKQMQKIIDAQGPSGCASDLAHLTFDVKAAHDGAVVCDRLPAAEPAGANRGRADRQGRRHQTVQEDRRPRRAGRAALPRLHRRPAGTRPRGGRDGHRTPATRSTVTKPREARRSREPSPSFRACRPGMLQRSDWRRGLGLGFGLGLPSRHRRAPLSGRRDPRHRSARRRRRPSSMHPARPAERQADRPALSPQKRCGATVQGGSCWSLPISATCARMRHFTRAKPSASVRSDGCSRRTVDRVITVDAHLHRTPDIADVFPGIEAENLSAMSIL